MGPALLLFFCRHRIARHTVAPIYTISAPTLSRPYVSVIAKRNLLSTSSACSADSTPLEIPSRCGRSKVALKYEHGVVDPYSQKAHVCRMEIGKLLSLAETTNHTKRK